jgi:hypothetical protein
MDAFKRGFDKLSDDLYKCKCTRKTKVPGSQEDIEKSCDETVVVGKDTAWNLKRHIARKHPNVFKEIEAKELGSYQFWRSK